ncbi:DUF2793 domain-containing protein [Falsiroseomonas sp.]|uniref:DUF2793 domain-containing protein n=1 Tax=Falsiroseomonas sp. TaxID=2870721 RepID=UPI003564EC60
MRQLLLGLELRRRQPVAFGLVDGRGGLASVDADGAQPRRGDPVADRLALHVAPGHGRVLVGVEPDLLHQVGGPKLHLDRPARAGRDRRRVDQPVLLFGCRGQDLRLRIGQLHRRGLRSSTRPSGCYRPEPRRQEPVRAAPGPPPARGHASLCSRAKPSVKFSTGAQRHRVNRPNALVQLVTHTPPGSLADGQCWIVGASPTGAWAGQANRLAQRLGGAWVFHAPFVGLVVFDAATLAQWGWNGSAWTLVVPRLLQASVTYDPPNLAAGEGVTTNAAVTGAALGDFARASFSLDLHGVTLTAWVSAAETVSVRFQNGTADAVDLGSGTLRVRMEKP